jgi:DNA-directed RNA polymerase specialized sigma24 family protein
VTAGAAASAVVDGPGVTDEVLAARAGAGDAGAFAQLYARWGRRVAGYLRWRVAAGDVEDLVQETFTRAWALLRAGAEPVVWPRWLFGVAAPVAVARHVGDRWERGLAADGLAALLRAGPVEACGPAGELPAELAAALAALTPARRRVVELRFLEGQSVAATAAVLGRTRDTVVRLSGLALRDLHLALTGERRPLRRAAPLAELLPVARQVAVEVTGAGRRCGRDALTDAFHVRGIPLGRERADLLAAAVRAVA